MRTPPSPRPSAIEVSEPLGDGPVAADAEWANGPGLSDAQRREARTTAFWVSLAAMHRWRWGIVAVTVLAAVLSVWISLMLPLWYAATTRVLPPEGGSSSGLGALIGNLSPIASSLIGGGGGDYSRYLAILGSRSMQESVVERFDLIRVYDYEDDVDPMGRTIKRLSKNTDVEVDMETDALTISVLDRDPQRAAQIANFLIDELNRRNETLALEGASRFRSYVETRYQQIELAMDSAQTAMTAFQQRNGVIELPSMVQGMIEAAAEQQSAIGRLEVQYQALLGEFGPENPQVLAAQRALETARRGQADLLGGREAVMPVAIARLPALAGEYARLYQEVMIQRALMEEARPLLEQARFDEERDRVAVQVLDRAVPPVRKAKPKRAYIVLAATASAFAISALLALFAEAYRRRRPSFASAFAQAKDGR